MGCKMRIDWFLRMSKSSKMMEADWSFGHSKECRFGCFGMMSKAAVGFLSAADYTSKE